MSDMKTIILVGFMGTGKTTVGKRVAERCGCPFLDLDDVIEENAGMAISQIFEDYGEPKFREYEREAVRSLLDRPPLVVAPGGGAVMDERNRAVFDEAGICICLLATPEAILTRVEKESHRPLLEQGDKADRIRKLYESRRKVYESFPLKIDTSQMSIEQVADRVEELARQPSPAS